MEKNNGVISRKTFLQKSVQVGVAGLTAHVIGRFYGGAGQ